MGRGGAPWCAGGLLVEALEFGEEGGGATPAEEGVAVDFKLRGDGTRGVAEEEETESGEVALGELSRVWVRFATFEEMVRCGARWCALGRWGGWNWRRVGWNGHGDPQKSLATLYRTFYEQSNWG